MKNKLPPFIEIYRAPIATPSIGATKETLGQNNADLAILLAGWSKDLGFSMEVQLMPGIRNKFNMLASCGQGAGGLLLTRHTGTVPLDDGCWTYDPFALTGHDGGLYGLGTTDMKGFFVFILDALHGIDVMRPAKPLCILVTADEGTSMAGARYFAGATALRLDCVTTGEPTLLQPVRARKGHISNAVCIQGQPSRSSDPTRGVNAIELIHNAIEHILQLRDNLKERYHYDAFTAPCPTLNLGHTYDGDASNRICACCELHMDIRPLPGMTLNELSGLPNDALASVSEHQPGRLTIDELHPPIPGYECPPSRQLVEVVEKLLGVETEVMNYRIKVSFIQTLYPALVLGPGSIGQAYQSDEYLETRFIKPTREPITQVIHHFCWYQNVGQTMSDTILAHFIRPIPLMSLEMIF